MSSLIVLTKEETFRRRNLPWTRLEILQLLERLKQEVAPEYRGRYSDWQEKAKLGVHSNAMVELYASHLVKDCGVCSLEGRKRKALYHTAKLEGRCSEHRRIP